MTYCLHKDVHCCCQPDDGVPCPYKPQPAPDIDKLIARLHQLANVEANEVAEIMVAAADAIAALRAERDALRSDRDEWKRKCGDANIWGLQNCAAWKARAERAEAERDALRECVLAADGMRKDEDCPMCDRGKLRNPRKEHWDNCPFAAYDRARAALDAALAEDTTAGSPAQQEK